MRSRILGQVAADHAFGRRTHFSNVRRRTHISVVGPKGPNSRTGGPSISTPYFRTSRQKGAAARGVQEERRFTAHVSRWLLAEPATASAGVGRQETPSPEQTMGILLCWSAAIPAIPNI